MAFSFRAPVPLFQVFNLEASIEFYVHVLKFEIVADSGAKPDDDTCRTWALLRADDLTLMLRTFHENKPSPLPDPARVAHHSDTVLYLSCDDLESLCSHLRHRGVTTSRGTDPFPHMDQVFLKDPDGYVLCFQRPSRQGIAHE